jgi:predicted metal-dependent hydrolase
MTIPTIIILQVAIKSDFAVDAHRFPKLQEGLPKEAIDFWDWHAIEEMEHKSVAFDVLTEIGGGYFNRMLTTVIFITLCAVSMIFLTPALVISEKITNRGKAKPADKSVTLKALEVMRPGVMGEWNKFIWQSFKNYFKPGFHPWQNNDIEYITHWREKNTFKPS